MRQTHQLRLVVYPIIYEALYIYSICFIHPKRWVFWDFYEFLNHQQQVFSASFCASGAIYLGVPARRSDGNWRFFRVGMIGILYLILKNNIIMIREKHPESP